MTVWTPECKRHLLDGGPHERKGTEINIATMHKTPEQVPGMRQKQNTERLWQRETKEKNPKLDDS